MRTFQFRLQPLLRLRGHARELAQAELARAAEQLRQVHGQRTEVEQHMDELEQHMRRGASSKQVDVDRLLDGHRHRLELDARLAKLAEAMSEAARQLEHCRKQLVEADRQVKVLEKLHAKQLADHGRRAAAEEVKQLDEAATISAVRKS
jgi:flagellar FliJ protein